MMQFQDIRFDSYHQTAFEDLEQIHSLISNDPEEFYKLYYRLYTMFIEKGYDEERSQMLAMTLMSFPYTGKDELTEDETATAVNSIQFHLIHGFPNLN